MKVSMPMLSLKAWGSIGEPAASFVHHVVGSGVFRRERNYVQLERYYAPFNPQTELQQEGRSMFASAVASWQGLSLEEKASWNFYQDDRRQKPIMSGYNLFISKFLLSAGNPVIPPSGRKGEGW